MGICDSVTENKSKKQNNFKSQTPTETDSNYILPQKLAIRDDINKHYSLSPQYIGEGESGIVYEEIDKDGKKCAIKRLNKTAIKDIQSVILEAEISLLVSHEYIIKCYNIFEDLKTISFVLELIEEGDLFSFIQLHQRANYQMEKLLI